MAVRVICDACGSKLRLNDSAIGHTFGCPICGHRVTVQDPRQPQPGATPAIALGHHEEEEELEPLMKKTKEINYEDLVDMTAMVDIVFFLLIYFLVSSLAAVDSAIDLPRPGGKKGAAGANVVAPEDEAPAAEVTVRIDRADRVTIDGTEVRGPDEAFLRLRELKAGPERPTVLTVVGSGDATHGTLVNVLDSAQELGFEKIKLSVVEDGDGAGN